MVRKASCQSQGASAALERRRRRRQEMRVSGGMVGGWIALKIAGRSGRQVRPRKRSAGAQQRDGRRCKGGPALDTTSPSPQQDQIRRRGRKEPRIDAAATVQHRHSIRHTMAQCKA